MKSVPRCAVQQEERLEELKRREDLERLRLPLTTHSLFPHHHNAATSQITVEELKKLVRHWKLHEVRGFWKTHPNKEDLIRALLNHMDDQDLIYEYETRAPTRPVQPKSRGREGFKKTGSVLKPYNGDIFGHHENTEGIIYLSRYDTKKVDLKNSGGVFGNSKKFNSFVDKSFFDKADPGAPDSDSDEDDDKSHNSKSANERRIGIAEQLYKYSTCVGIEQSMLREGTVEALDDFAHMDDPRALNCASAVLANLTVPNDLHDLRLKILETGIITDVILPLHSKGSALPDIGRKALAITMYRLTTLEDKVMSIYGQCGDAMVSLLKSEDEETRMCAAASLVNVTGAMVAQKASAGEHMMVGGDDRQRIVEQVMPFLKDLVNSKKSHVRIGLARAFKNFSLYENARVPMVEAGVCESLLKLVSYKELDEYRIDVITTIANLTNVVDGRERMIRDGIISCIVKLGNDGDTDDNKKLVACAMANLTGVNESMIRHVVMNGAAKCLVTLCAIVDHFEESDTIDIRVAAGLANLTVHTSSVLKLISSDVHTSLMVLAKDEGVPSLREAFDLVDSDGQGTIDTTELGRCMNLMDVTLTDSQVRILIDKFDKDDSGVLDFSEFKTLVKWQADQGQAMSMRTRQVLVSIGLCNLLSDFNAHDALVKSGIIDCLKGLADMNDPKVNVVCAKAFSNLVANPKMRSKIMTDHIGVFEEWLDLINTKDLDCCKVCGNAIVHITYDSISKPEVIALMIEKGVLKAVNTMIELGDSYLHFYCASILCNLVNEKSAHETLVQNGILGSLDRLTAETEETETKIWCAAALWRLSASLAGDYVKQLIASLSLLLINSSDPDVTHYISAAFFKLSSRPECMQLLASDDSIHKLLISMMRGAPGDTQIHGAKALCNLTCDLGCAGLLLEKDHVSDFVVIAILRTNSSLIKEICSQSLFNLLHHVEYRERMVEKGVLWALIKLSKLDSRETQKICARMLFNFSCYEHMQERIMEHGVPRLLAIATTHDADIEDSETKQFCAGALCNLAFRPEAGGLYAKGGAIGFLKELMDVQNDDNEMYCSTIMFNLSHCEIEARLMLVHEGAVPLLINLSRSEKQRTIVACLSSCYNLTLNMDARKEMVRDDIAPPILNCLDHTQDLVLIELGLASLYHLSVNDKHHDAQSCVHMVQGDHVVGFVVRMYEKFGQKSEIVGKLCSRVLLNLALEVDNHKEMVAGGVLEICGKFLKSSCDEERKNVRKLMSFLGNSDGVLKEVLTHPSFDEFTSQMFELGGDYELLVMSQMFLNFALQKDCCKSLLKKKYFEKFLVAFSLKSEELNWNVVKVIKLMVENKDSKPGLLKTGCAGIMSRVSQATKDQVLFKLCGKILNGMSSRKSTVTYSEGSIVAVLSTFEEPDYDEEEMVIKSAKVEVEEEQSVVIDCVVGKIAYDAIDPTWSLFEVKGEKEKKKLSEEQQLPVATLAPPKVFTLQTNGQFEKVEVPNLGKVILPDIELVSDGEESGEELEEAEEEEGGMGPEVESGGEGNVEGLGEGVFMELSEDKEEEEGEGGGVFLELSGDRGGEGEGGGGEKGEEKEKEKGDVFM